MKEKKVNQRVRMDGDKVLERTILRYYELHSDHRNCWLKVPIHEVISVGIIDKISAASYMDDEYLFLDGVEDSNLFIKAVMDAQFLAFPECRHYSDPSRWDENVSVDIDIIAVDKDEFEQIRSDYLSWDGTVYVSDLPSDYTLVSDIQDIKHWEEMYPQLVDHEFEYLYILAYNGEVLDIWGSDGNKVYDRVYHPYIPV